MKKKLQVVKFNIAAANAVEKINTESDNHYNRIKGVFVTCSKANAEKQSTLQLEVDKEEIFPDDFEISLINPTTSNSYKDVSYGFDEKAEGNKIEGTYTDGGNAASYPYEVKIYFEATEGKEE